MSNSVFFKTKDTVESDKHDLLEIFFKDWVDHLCNNRVLYKIEKTVIKNSDVGLLFRIDFEKQEDALAMVLTGVPAEFQHYLEPVPQSN